MVSSYARLEFISAGQGLSAVQRLAYVCRQRLVRPLTGRVYDYTDRDDLVGQPVTSVPEDAPERLRDPLALWTDVEAKGTRTTSVLGLELVLALPRGGVLTLGQMQELTEGFIGNVIMPDGVGVTWALHAPHGKNLEEVVAEDERGEHEIRAVVARNPHAHVLITPRRITAAGLHSRRETGLEVVWRRTMIDAMPWRSLWRHYQDSYFRRLGLNLRVRARAPIQQRREGVRPARSEDGGKGVKDHNAAVETANAQLVATFDGLRSVLEASAFRREEVEALAERFFSDDPEYVETIVGAALGLGEVAFHCDPQTGQMTGWYSTNVQRHHEDRALAAAMVLSLAPRQYDSEPIQNAMRWAQTPDHLQRPVSEAVAAGGIVVVEAIDEPRRFRSELDAVLRRLGARITSIGHRAATLRDKVEDPDVLTVGLLREGLKPQGDTLVVDRADALAPADLANLLEAAQECQARVLLLRRHEGPAWPRSELLDVLATTFGAVHVGDRPRRSWQEALAEEACDAVERLEEADRLVWVRDDQGIIDEVTRRCFDLHVAGERCFVLLDDDVLVAELRRTLDEQGIPGEIGPRLAEEDEEAEVVAVHRQDQHRRLAAVPQLARAKSAVIVVARSQTPDHAALARQIRSHRASLVHPRQGPDGPVADIPADGRVDFTEFMAEPLLDDISDFGLPDVRIEELFEDHLSLEDLAEEVITSAEADTHSVFGVFDLLPPWQEPGPAEPATPVAPARAEIPPSAAPERRVPAADPERSWRGDRGFLREPAEDVNEREDDFDDDPRPGGP